MLIGFLPHEQLCSRGISCRNSVCPSVCHTRALWQHQTMHCGYFDNTRKDNQSSFLTPTVVGGRRPFCLKFSLKMTHRPSKNADFDRFPL